MHVVVIGPEGLLDFLLVLIIVNAVMCIAHLIWILRGYRRQHESAPILVIHHTRKAHDG